ncbi:hypothetical protein [Epilithonimonas vandammei]|uniref:hypothetical protein n=1 Tax=Epilithonimonas vandammei TaxID=2487072 RepID=UPI0028AE6040|nr:hypothetical protein [Epilithonimonas vandammei]
MNLEQLKADYLKFFEEFKINQTTGILEDYPSVKFATMPHIGSKYSESKYKILFVGQDIGKDETVNYFQDFYERNQSVEKPSNFNPHIAGTYSSALFLLKDLYKWDDVWEKHNSYSTYSQATKNILHKENENPLSFIALTNLHKFVTSSRENRAGDVDRKFIKREVEEKILIKEIEALKPNLVLFQGKKPSGITLEIIKSKNIEVKLAKHPSYRAKNGRKPEVYVETFDYL